MTIVDVSELKIAERLRFAEKEIFETVVNDLEEAVLRVNLDDNKVVLCNHLFADLYGKTVEEMTGSLLHDVVGHDIAEPTLQKIKEHNVGESFSDHITVNAGKKDEKIISRRVRIIGNRKGKAIAYQATGLDVTEQFKYSEALEALIAVEETPGIDFDSAIEKMLGIGCNYFSMPIGLSARLGVESHSIEQAYGLKDTKIIGQAFDKNNSLEKILPDDFDPVSVDDIGQSDLNGKPLFGYKKFGALIGIRVHTSKGAYGALSFLSEDKRPQGFSVMECTMVQLIARNIGALLERKLQYQALDIRRQELENLNEGLNRFTYLASHDLQEPLRKIQQSGEFLKADFGDVLDEEGHYFLRIMRESAGRMRSLIDDLLLYSASANQDLETTSVVLNTIVDGALAELESQIKATEAKIDVKKLPKVACDAKVVKQVFINIIGNSLKYAQADVAPEINISSKKGATHTEIIISDNGIGLDLHDDINVFEPFVRLHSKTEYAGSGIGLAICKSVCDRHGWTIQAVSEDNNGTVITLSIPNEQIA